MTPRAPHVERLLLVVMDGLRSDAMPLFGMPVLESLAQRGAWTLQAATVSPSVTAAAMGSLLTGVPPCIHGLESDRFGLPRPTEPLQPLPAVLRQAGIPTRAFLARLPRAYRSLASALAGRLGVEDSHFEGDDARAVSAPALAALRQRAPGLYLFHWPDADRAGHAAGWTSRPYARAVRAIDQALGALVETADLANDPSTVLLALADHGGGGHDPRNHASAHPMDQRIPMVLAGAAVREGTLGGAVSLLDATATAAWALGAPVPATWRGRVLHEAFVDDGQPGDDVHAVPFAGALAA